MEYTPGGLARLWSAVGSLIVVLLTVSNSPAQPSPVPAESSATIWANPLRGGPIDALLIGPESATSDFASLAQRLQMKSTEVAFNFNTREGTGREPRPVFSESGLERLSQSLRRPYDVIVLARIGLGDLPDKQRQLLRSRLDKGTGLLLVHYGADEATAAAEKLESLPRSDSSASIERGFGSRLLSGWQQGLDTVNTFEDEDQRVAEIAYWSNAAHSHCLIPAPQDDTLHAPTTVNNYFSRVARALCWAAGRDPFLKIESIEDPTISGPDDIDTPPQLPKEFIQRMRDAAPPLLLQPYELKLDKIAKKKYRIRAQARYPYRNIQTGFFTDATLERGEDGLILDLPVGYGDFFLDCWILDGNTVVDWFTKAVRRDGWPEISDIKFSTLAIEPNDSIEISMQVRRHFHRPRPSMVFARATDSLGRIVAEEGVRVSEDGGEATVELRLVDLLAPYLKIEVFAADAEEGPLNSWMMAHCDYAFAHALVRESASATFRFAALGSHRTDYNLRVVNREHARYGVDTIHLPQLAHPPGAAAMDHLDAIPALGPFDLTAWDLDADLRTRQAYALEEQALSYRHFSPGLYMLNAEDSASSPQIRISQSEARRPMLQRFLRMRYPNLAALNAAWGSAHKDWDQAATAALDGPKSMSTRMDLASFEEDTTLRGYLSARNVIQAIDPRAQVGLPTPLPEELQNTPSLIRRTGFILVDAEPLDLKRVGVYRSTRSTALLKVDRALSEYPEQFTGWLPWYATLHGLDGIWLDRKVPLGRRNSGDSTFVEDSLSFFEALAREVQVVRSGYSELLKRARRTNSSIALYDSHSSAKLDQISPADNYSMRAAQVGFANLLSALGYSYDMIDYEALVEGQLRKYRLCILPFSRALSDEEIMALREFNTNGGTLLADILPGRFDEHAAPRSPNPFDETFRVESTGRVNFAPPASIQLRENPKRPRQGTKAESARADRSVQPLNDSHLATSGDTPIAIVTQSGKGQAILLNYSLGKQSAIRQPHFDTWLEESGAIKLLDTPVLDSSAFSGTVSTYNFHGADIYAFLRNPAETKSAEAIRLPVPSDRHAYDPLTARHFRPGTTATFKVLPGDVALLASLEYEVSRVKITAPEHVRKGARLQIHAEIKTRAALPKDHMVHVELTDPDDTLLPHYSRTLDCPDGDCATYIPMALNDSGGTYTVTVRDLLSGKTGRVEVLVF